MKHICTSSVERGGKAPPFSTVNSIGCSVPNISHIAPNLPRPLEMPPKQQEVPLIIIEQLSDDVAEVSQSQILGSPIDKADLFTKWMS